MELCPSAACHDHDLLPARARRHSPSSPVVPAHARPRDRADDGAPRAPVAGGRGSDGVHLGGRDVRMPEAAFARRSAPRSTRWVANACRSPCSDSGTSIPARSASRRISANTARRVSLRPRAARRKTSWQRRDATTRPLVLDVALERRAGRASEQDDAPSSPFAGGTRSARSSRKDRIEAQRDRLVTRSPGVVEHLEQRQCRAATSASPPPRRAAAARRSRRAWSADSAAGAAGADPRPVVGQDLLLERKREEPSRSVGPAGAPASSAPTPRSASGRLGTASTTSRDNPSCVPMRNFAHARTPRSARSSA